MNTPESTTKAPTLYKAVRPSGTDFHTGSVYYLSSETIRHPRPLPGSSNAANYLSVTSVLGDFPGASWPWRILEVEPVGEWWVPGGDYPNKVAVEALRVVRELEPWEGFGPQGEQINAFIAAISGLGVSQIRRLGAALDAAWGAARGAALGAAWALVVRDVIGERFTQEQYDHLTGPWRRTIGKLHADDLDIYEAE